MLKVVIHEVIDGQFSKFSVTIGESIPFEISAEAAEQVMKANKMILKNQTTMPDDKLVMVYVCPESTKELVGEKPVSEQLKEIWQ